MPSRGASTIVWVVQSPANGAESSVSARKSRRLWLVRALNVACTTVDGLLYRPVIVRLTEWLPRWWCCELARLSMALDDRWQTGYWRSESAPPAPIGRCDACNRRAAWLVRGGREDDDIDSSDAQELDEPTYDDDYLRDHPVHLCGWCRLTFSSPPRNQAELDQLLADARRRSVSWRWTLGEL
jgi:hypothetical protein